MIIWNITTSHLTFASLNGCTIQYATIASQLGMQQLHRNSVCNSCFVTRYVTVGLQLSMQQLDCNSVNLQQQFLLEYFIVSLLLFDARFKRFQNISDWWTYPNEADSKTLTEIYKEIKGYKVK